MTINKITDEQIVEDSNRTVTQWGHMRVDNCILTAESIDGYLGKELKSSSLPPEILAKLEDNKVYQVYRPAEELEKAVDTYNLVPLTDEHHFVDHISTNKNKWLGAIGSKAYMDGGKIKNDLSIWDAKEVLNRLDLKDDISEFDFKQKVRNSLTLEKPREGLSGGYAFKLVDEAGQWNGKHYDFKMKDINCNHVALVGKPRVAVAKLADNNSLNIFKGSEMDLLNKIRQSHPQIVADAEAEMEKEAKDKKVKDGEYKESTKGGEHSTDKACSKKKDNKPEVEDEDMEDGKPEESKGKDAAIVEAQVFTADSIQALVKEQLAQYNKARDICERAIGKVSFAADASPEDMYNETLKALKVDFAGYAIDTKHALIKHIADTKVSASVKQPVVIVRDSNTADDFKTIKL